MNCSVKFMIWKLQFPRGMWLEVKTGCELCVQVSECLFDLWRNRQLKPNIKAEKTCSVMKAFRKTKSNLQEKSDNSKAISTISDTTAAEAAQHIQLITLNHNLCWLLLCRDIVGNKRGAAFSGEAVGRKESQVVGNQASVVVPFLEQLT